MLRTVQITLPGHETESTLAHVRQIPGLLSLQLQQGASLQPPGDIITAQLRNPAFHDLMHYLSERGIGDDRPISSVSTSEPNSIIASGADPAIQKDSTNVVWEEMEVMLGKESNMTTNTLVLMAISGVLAVSGIATNALHLVIGAMVIAPGFEPITRAALGVVARNPNWLQGAWDTLKGYAALVLGAMGMTLILRATNKPAFNAEPAYLEPVSLASYWSTSTLTSVIVTILASVGGAILIATNRSVLTAGVMIALSIIPAAALVGMALVIGDWNTLGNAGKRWLVEVTLIFLASAGVFLVQYFVLQKRPMYAASARSQK
jgi:uncharacterized hydrophobic protein (TIGR00271 family)